jgi:hypothetical protein
MEVLLKKIEQAAEDRSLLMGLHEELKGAASELERNTGKVRRLLRLLFFSSSHSDALLDDRTPPSPAASSSYVGFDSYLACGDEELPR